MRAEILNAIHADQLFFQDSAALTRSERKALKNAFHHRVYARKNGMTHKLRNEDRRFFKQLDDALNTAMREAGSEAP